MYIAGWKVADNDELNIFLVTDLQPFKHLLPVFFKIGLVGKCLKLFLLTIPVLPYKNHILSADNGALGPVKNQFQLRNILC